MRQWKWTAIAIFFTLTTSSTAFPVETALEARIGGTARFVRTPQDLVVAADGKHWFVLLEKGEVLVYSAENQLEGRLQVAPETGSIAVAPQGERLYAIDAAAGTVQIVEIDYLHLFDTAEAPFRGPEEAPVAIVVFDDFQCPYCARLVPVLDDVLKRYPDKVRIVFKNFPLRSHRLASRAAVAAMAAHEQGAFWPYHDRLYANFRNLDGHFLTETAKELGLDMKRFEKSLEDRKILDRINLDILEGKKAGVRGTPAVFINGKLLRDRSPEGFRRAIEQELEKH